MQEPDLDEHWYPANLRATILTVGAILAIVVAFGVGLVASPTPTTPDDVTLSTFTDSADRVCTQVTTSSAVAIDCDFPPAENRVGSWLDGFGEQP